MPKVSSKRQITLPIGGCEALGIAPGDEVEILLYGNQFNIIKKQTGAAKGFFQGLPTDLSVSEKQSLYSSIDSTE